MTDEEIDDMPRLLRPIEQAEITFLQFQPEMYEGRFIKQTIVDGTNGNLLEVVWTRQAFMDGVAQLMATGEWLTKPSDKTRKET